MDPRFKDLVEKLSSPLQDQRDRARGALSAAGTVAVPALLIALEHPERDTRAGACLALAEIRDRRAGPALVETSREDEDLSVRQLALRALSEISGPGVDPEIRACLLEHLAHPDMFSRALACKGLGKVADDQARRALEEALNDTEAWVRNAATEALAAKVLGKPTLREGSPASSKFAGQALAVRDAVAQLLRDLLSLDAKVQRRAQAGLFQQGPGVIPRLAPIVLGGPVEARRSAVEVLALLGRAEALSPLGILLEDENLPESLRPVVLHAVARILAKDPEGDLDATIELVRRHLCHEDQYVRAGAVAALFSAGPGPRQEALTWLLDEEDEPWVMLAACRSLSRAATLSRGDEDLVPSLLDLLGRAADLETQVCLLEALAREMPRPDPDNQTMVAPVSYFLESEAPDVRRAAARLLIQAAPKVDRPTLKLLVEMVEEKLAPDSLTALIDALARLTPSGDPLPVPALERLLYRADLETGRVVVRTLAAIGGRDAVQSLVEAANSQRGPVVAHSAQALAGLDPRSNVVALRAPDGRWRAEERLWCACGGELRWVVRDEREQLRCPQCDTEYLQSMAGKTFAAGKTPFGACLCRACRRKRPLVRRGSGEVLVCPESAQVHVRPYDHPAQLRLEEDLPMGACSCCDEPQPLIRVDSRVVCYRTKEPYQANPGRGYARAGNDEAARDDVDAINRALLMGTLGLAESGIAADRSGEDDDEQ